MADPKKSKPEPRTITLWVMLDRTAKPHQHQVRVKTLKVAAAIAVILPLILIVTGVTCAGKDLENRALARIARQHLVSGQKLQALSDRVSELETRSGEDRGQARRLVAAVQKDLKFMVPDGAAGGGQSRPRRGSYPPLSPSQEQAVHGLEERLARLDHELKTREQNLTELEAVWKDRHSILSALPSRWPLDGGYVSSDFGLRIHPISGQLKMHDGIDVFSPAGDPIYAAGPGVVAFAGEQSGYGFCVSVNHGFGLSTFYAHCSKLLVTAGQPVRPGQAIARVGSTGASTGPHLHFEVRIRGNPVDPLDYVSIFSGLK